MSLLQANLAGLGGSGAPGGALAGGVYSHELNQSLRFEDGDSPDLARAYSTAQTNTKIITVSVWVKRSNISNSRSTIIFAKSSGAGRIAFENNNTLLANAFDTGYNGFTSNAVFRDVGSWYHIVYQGDSTQATASNRHKVWVNGVEQTNANSSSLTPQNAATNILRNSNTTYIGRDTDSSNYYFDGYLAEMHVIDGSVVAPTSFGETVDGVWVPKAYSGSYGTNGFYLPFAQSDSAGFSTYFHTKNTSNITHSDSSSFDIGSSDDFTVELFFNTNDIGGSGTSGYGNFIGHYATAGPHFLVGYDFRGSARDIYWYTGNGASFKWDVSGDVTLKSNKFHHLAFQRDGTTLRAYVDGTRLTSVTDAASNTGYTLSDGKSTNFNKAYDLSQMKVGDPHGNGFDGYLSNLRIVIGNTVYADDDSDITVPTGTLTAVTGTKLLTCHNATVGDDASTENNDGSVTSAVASTVGPFSTSNYFQDASGQQNHFQPSANLRTTDVVLDSPTNNFPTWNSLQPQGAAQTTNTLSEGNLKAGNSASAYGQSMGSMSVLAGKWYTETYINDTGYPSWHIGWTYGNRFEAFDGGTNSDEFFAGFGYFTGSLVYFTSFGETYAALQKAYSGIHTAGDAPTTGDVISCAADFDNGKFWWAINGEWLDVGSGAGDPANDSNPARTFTVATYADKYKSPWVMNYNGSFILNAGQDSTFAGNITAGGNSDENGHGDFKYSVPSGFLALCSANLPEPTIGPGQTNQADDFFETMLYTGTAKDQHIGAGGAQHPQDIITIANSLKFNHADSSFLSYSPGANGDTKIMTYSGWIKRGDTSKYQLIFQAVDSQYDSIWIEPTNHKLQVILGSTSTAIVASTRAIRDTSKWYHICINIDTTQATDTDRIKVWIDGVQETLDTSGGGYPTQNAVFAAWFKNSITHRINYEGGSTYGSGYYAEVHVIEGTAYDYTYFGQVGTNGYWIPKTVSGITYGDEGFYLDFADSSAIGDDESGNTNDFTTTNTAATDVTIDSPTQNFSTMDPNRYSGIGTFSQGNLTVATSTNNRATYGTIAVPSSGKWYYEVRVDSYASGGGTYMGWGTNVAEGDNEYAADHGISFSSYNEQVLLDNSSQSGGYGSNGTNVASNGDVYSVLLDVDNGLFYYAKNGTYFNSANPSNGTGGLSVGDVLAGATTEIRPILTRGGSYNETYTFNFGQDASFNGGETAPATAKTDANGVGEFLYDVPTGFLALMDDNIPVEGIASPDFVWIKNRSATQAHNAFDTVRGAGKLLYPNLANTEYTSSIHLNSFDHQGFSVGSATSANGSTNTIAAWTWKAGGISPTQTYTVKVVSDSGNKYRFDDFGTSAITLSLQEGGTYTFDQSDSSNSGHPLRFSTTSDGTHNSGSEYTVGVTTSGTPGSSGAKTVITVAHGAPTLYYYCSSHSGMGGQANTTETHGSTNLKGSIQSVVSASQDAGFSIIRWTGNQTNSTIGHGLTSAPEFVTVKNMDYNLANWYTWTKFTTNDKVLFLNATNAETTSAPAFVESDMAATTVGLGTERVTNGSSEDMLAYVFHSVEGYSKVGTYEGNNNANGPFVYTGFRPAWIMIKEADATGYWMIIDTKRYTRNDNNTIALAANDSWTESTINARNQELDILSNGFKIRNSGGDIGYSGTHIYLAFAEAPFKYANAR